MEAWTRLEPDVRAAEIMKVARRQFARDGFANVSMASIADEAGVTPGLVNHYFGTKRKLYVTVIKEAAQRLPKTVRRDLEGLSREETIELSTTRFLDSAEQEPEAWALTLGAAGQRDPEIDKLLAAGRDTIIERMAHNHTEPGEEPTDELRLALRCALEGAGRAAREWLAGRTRRDQAHAVITQMLGAVVDQVVPNIPK